jgi:hypothetical protein
MVNTIQWRLIRIKIVNVSKQTLGVQVVVNLYEPKAKDDKIVEGHESWPRWSNCAKQLQRELSIEGRFIQADLKSFIGGLLQVQLTWCFNEEPRTSSVGSDRSVGIDSSDESKKDSK